MSGVLSSAPTTTIRRSDLSKTKMLKGIMLDALRKATLGEYEVLGELGSGGMASVYLAHDLALDRKVAIKVMSPSLLEGEGMVERFKREAKTSAALSHPHIIPIYAVKETDQVLFFVMKCVEGRPLDSIIKEVHKLPIGMVQAILSQVGSALGYAHRNGVVHRDIKPANVMIDKEGWAVVTDFGIAKVTEADGLTMTGATVGTPAYMSPEQCSAKDVGGSSDQYSLGVVAYEMLTGKQPFLSDTLMGMMWAHVNDPAPPVLELRPDCPPALADVVSRMLAKSPAERWSTLEEAVAQIGAAPLAHDDPVRTRLIKLAKDGNTALISQFRTPSSPVPLGKSGAAPASPPAMKTVNRTAPAAADSAPPQPSVPSQAAPAAPQPMLVGEARGSSRKWVWVALVAVVLAGGGGAAWLVTSRTPTTPPPVAPDPIPAPTTVGSVEIDAAPPSLAPGAEVRLTARVFDESFAELPGEQVAWRSSNPSVAVVAADGTLSAVGPGTVVIVARSGARADTVTLQITDPRPRPGPRPAPVTVASVRLTPEEATLRVGERTTLRAVALDANGRSVAGRGVDWTSGDPAVVQVVNGRIQAVRPGTTVITATVDTRTAQAMVTVTPVPVAEVLVRPPEGAITVGQTVQLRATVRDARGAPVDRQVQWRSSDPGVAAVSPSGLVTATGAGQARITASSNGQSSEVTVVIAAREVEPAGPTDQELIATVIQRYARALESRDIASVKRLNPGMSSQQEDGLTALFRTASELSVAMDISEVVVTGDRARVFVSQTFAYRAGRRSDRNTTALTMVLQRAATGWQISAIE